MRIGTIVLFYLIFSHQALAQFEADRHSTNFYDAWISCEQSPCPDSKWGERHWIMYEMEAIYVLGKTKIWNYNDRDNNGIGVRDVMIEYSINGQDWIEWGLYEFDEADPTSFYQGEEGPDLSGIEAKYLLFTVLSNHGGGSCVGIGEIKIETEGWALTGNKDLTQSIKLELSPNPTTDITNLAIQVEDNSPISIIIIDPLGRRVKELKVQPNGLESNLTLDVSSFQSGIYYVYLRQHNKVAHQQLNIIK